jgi:S1-C subfamily serine protease
VHVTVQAWPEAGPIDPGGEYQRALGLEFVLERRENGDPVVAVASVDPNGTAADSGIQKGDMIVEIQQTDILDPTQANDILATRSFARHPFAAVLVERKGKRTWIPIAVPRLAVPGAGVPRPSARLTQP